MNLSGLHSCPTLAFRGPEQSLFFAPAIVARRSRCPGEFLRGHGAEIARVLVQSVAEFVEDLHSLSIAGCSRFCAQLTDPVLESAAGHHEYKSGNAYKRVDCLLFRAAERFRKFTAGSISKTARRHKPSAPFPRNAPAKMPHDLRTVHAKIPIERVSAISCSMTHEF